MTDENLNDSTPGPQSPIVAAGEPAATSGVGAPPQYGVGPFSVREVAIGGVWVVAFIVSFFPVNRIVGGESVLLGGTNVWVSGLAWVLTIGVPTLAVFLLALRRLSPHGIPRFGSLGIDQFASVAFSVAAIVWLQTVWDTVAIMFGAGVWVRSWVIWVELVLMLAGVVLTVLAPFIPVLEQDFHDRSEVPAHRNARPIRPVVARPKAERPAPDTRSAAPAPQSGFAPEIYDTGVTDGAPAVVHGTATHDTATHDSAAHDTGAYGSGAYGSGAYVDPSAETGAYGTDVFASLHEPDQQREPEQSGQSDDTVRTGGQAGAPAQQAFWALVPVERDVVDDYGAPLFRIGPTAWALVIEDRGEAFVVRHEDGRLGYLHDVTGVTRG